jgi:hypothetical protein
MFKFAAYPVCNTEQAMSLGLVYKHELHDAALVDEYASELDRSLFNQKQKGPLEELIYDFVSKVSIAMDIKYLKEFNPDHAFVSSITPTEPVTKNPGYKLDLD